MNDMIMPSLNTTIAATIELLYQLGTNPDQSRLLREDRALIENAVTEAVRIGTPIRSFTRTLTQEYTLAGVSLPSGSRTMVLFASANRDERRFPAPDRFHITRAARDHVGFGHGVHMCLGMHLAKLEMSALLRAMLDRAERIEVGTPTVAMHYTIHAFASLPVTLQPFAR